MEDIKKTRERALKIIAILRKATAGMTETASASVVNAYGRDPYLVLVSCILSLRTKDSVSWPASRRLFSLATNPKQMLKLTTKQIEEAIYPVGFYRTKAAQILEISKTLIDRFDGQVPRGEDELLSLKGVGRKTMNLVLAEGFGQPAICVDVHVHRISNRLGLVKTKTPDETEVALKKILPRDYWREYNSLLVMWGQNVCVPVSPFCSRCAVFDLCKRVGVTKSR